MTEEKKDVELDAEAGKVKLKRNTYGDLTLIDGKNEKELDRAIAEHEKER